MYEIPQQLEYKEKIVFGLTFKQLAYALLFFPIIFILLFKIGAPLWVRIMLSIIPILFAVGFMFFDLSTLIKNWYTWFKLRDLNTNEKLSKALPIGTISDNLIHYKNKKIAVLKVNSINFAMKHKEEKDVIALAFQKFLNSIDFPLQILMTTETLSLNEYLNRNNIDTQLYTTKKPDIVFDVNGKKYAIEVETGKGLSNIDRMGAKLKVLSQYDEWFFVVTDRNKVKKYKKYGKTVDERYIKTVLKRIVKLAKT